MKQQDDKTPPGSVIRPERMRFSLTGPQLVSVVVVVAAAVIGWMRIDGRLTRIEQRLTALDHLDSSKVSSVTYPALANTP